MMVSSSETIMPPLMMSGVRFQPEDFRLLVGPLYAPVALVARPGLAINNLRELLAYQRDAANPALSYGSLGHGTIAHLAAEHFARLAGVAMTHVPYRGGTPLVNDLLGNQVDLSFLPLAGASLQLADSGKLKVFGLASAERLPRFARYDTLTDHPALKGFVHSAWNSFAVSTAVPMATAERLNAVLNAILQTPEMRVFAASAGSHIDAPVTLAEAAAFYDEQIRSTRALARAVNLQMQ
jgi:tripartite-type tricarboxylate transporter receptor subunit TctC